ncbi:MAG: hypothetical protein ACM3JD_01405 [Rudaea sp.]
MDLAPWRDVALMLLCLEAFVLMLVPGVIFYFAQKYLRKFRHWLRMPILRVYVYALRAQNLTLRASNSVVGVPIGMRAFSARLRTTAARLVGR